MDQPAAPLAARRGRDTGDRGYTGDPGDTGGRRRRPASSEPVRPVEAPRERAVVPLLWGGAVVVTGAWAGLFAAVVRWVV